MKQLRISSSLALPVDAATQTFLVVGKRGSGKSTTAARLVEQLLKASVPVVVLDVVDTWWGLKASRDGRGAGHDVYVFGGRHADLPLEAHGGALIADVLCEHRVSMVLSCKHLSGAARSQFMVDFATTLYQKWSGGVLHLVLEEAHELAPQAPPRGEKAENMLGAFKRLWKLGRSSGIGGTAITQRPASLSKDVTTQSEILVVHRTIGPQDVEAVKGWIRYRHQPETILAELATLKTGEAFVWAPEFPEDDPIGLKRVQVLPRDTFDSSATPKHGEQRVEPKALAPVDLERLRSKMAKTIERAKAEDPRELKRQLAEERAKGGRLQRDLEASVQRLGRAVENLPSKRIEVPILKDAQVKRLEAAVERARDMAATLLKRQAQQVDQLSQRLQVVVSEAGLLQDQIKAATGAAARDTQSGTAGRILAADGRSRAAVPRIAAVPARPAPVVRPGNGFARDDFDDTSDASAPQRVLRALAQYGEMDARKLAILAGIKRSGSTYRGALAKGRNEGLIEKGRIALTPAGQEATKDLPGLPRGEQLRSYWTKKLGQGAAGRVYRELIKAWPQPWDAEALAAAASTRETPLVVGGSTWRGALAKLRGLDLVPKRELKASDELFEDA